MTLNDFFLTLGALLGAGLAIRGFFNPFLGLLVLMSLHFIQPGEMFPALAPLRIELVYGVLMLIILLRDKSSEIKDILKNDRIVRATLRLLAVVVLTIPFAIWRGGALGMAVELSKMIMLQLLMTFFIDSQDRLRSILWLLVGFMMWFSGSALLGYLNGQYYVVNGVQRAEGVNSMAGDPNELAGVLMAFLPFLVALVSCSKRFLVRLLLIGCGALTLIVLVLTGARISMVALLALVIFYILRSRRKVLNLIVAAVLAAAGWFLLPAQYQQRYLTVSHYAGGGKLDDSNALRLAVWDAGWRMFLDHPILGVGAGQFATAYGTLYLERKHSAWMQPHNLFLQLVCELGLVGLFVFALLAVQIWKAISVVLRMRSSPGLAINYHFAVACNFMLIGVALISTVSHTLYRPYWYLLAGLVAANKAVALRVLDHERGSEAELPHEDLERENTFGRLHPAKRSV
jgi:putative inorganic carbon (HCO3(-)) transporter